MNYLIHLFLLSFKEVFSSSFSFKNLLFFQFYLFMFFLFSNNKYLVLFFVISYFSKICVLQKGKPIFFIQWKECSTNLWKFQKKFWKNKKCTFIQFNFSLNENIYSIFGTFYFLPIISRSFLVEASFMFFSFETIFGSPIFYCYFVLIFIYKFCFVFSL